MNIQFSTDQLLLTLRPIRRTAGFVLMLSIAFGAPRIGTVYAAPPVAQVSVTRLAQNPLITPSSSATLGDNINGPTVIRVPTWVEKPLGRYYMYFAHHAGRFIRLAYADSIEGPWKIYEPGVLPVEETAFSRPQPEPPEILEHFYTHIASPEIYVDEVNRRIVVWYHGWWTEGAQWPASLPVALAWTQQHQYSQRTQVASSRDGLHFTSHPSITKSSYLRVFQHDGYFYGMSRLGLMLRSPDPLAIFEIGINAFRESSYAGRVRHVALLRRDRTLYVFFTGIGDAPERIMMSTIDLTADWKTWKASPPIDVLRPEAPCECPMLPNEPSKPGDIKGPAQQVRDPAIFEENGRIYLFYSICGEQGIAAATLTFH